ncbi:PQQ-binding-like beta-propeller repeat protein [Rhodococcus sp. IEGM 1366]|uniref:outer membrane protein assembly factor BamB family protein n=1 Tax=Rhodococcus sp. IEGM 1366 TaxID=3082223 RepID=UPI002952F3E5|nr:PQQ-binding-like beta-propeller repeat protein [Rhodococcus sp. IEGM 1366]MDV8069664.1 PQQ-binding-like beta-propeller repeat protein [Rhodococcus sp. IEGM 1366]
MSPLRSMTPARFGSLLVAATTVLATGFGSSTGSIDGSLEPDTSVYADTGWVTLHGDSSNRRQQLGVQPAQSYTRWTALQGASILTAPTMLPNGNLAITTGKAEGSANLHVLDKFGTIVWETPAWSGKTGVDSAAIISSPIIDADGNIFVSDADQLWSYTSGGALRWVIDLPAAPSPNPFADGSRAINPFVTAAFTKDGAVFGTTVFGQVMVVDRATGELRAPVFQLPGSIAKRHTKTPMSPNMWAGGMMDPVIKDPIFQIIMGGIVQSANTPAVDSVTGRVYVAATDKEQDKGALYGLDITPPKNGAPGSISIAFAAQMGPGSGSSPVISPDGKTVYTCDDEGLLYAFDATSGKELWNAPSGAAAAAVAVDAQGSIYALTNPGVLSAYSAAGAKLWDADLSELTNATLPVSDVYGAPIVRGNGNPTVVNGSILIEVFYGYDVPIQGYPVSVPVKSAIVDIDPATGKGMRNIGFATDTTEGILAVTPDGRIFSTLGVMTSTAVAPLAPMINPTLPDGLELIAPSGGLDGFIPNP